MYGITQDDINFIDNKIENQKKYLRNFTIDFGDKKINMLDNTYSANLNPKKYFAEINNRVNTLFNYAKDNGLRPVFVTLTAPSKFHRYDVTPNETAKALTKIWNLFTNLQIFQKMKRDMDHGLIYFRVYEPHKSGVPHLHAMIFLPSSYILPVKKKFYKYFSSTKWGANEQAIDFRYAWYKEKGGATAYIMKYITKTFRDENSVQIQHAIYWYIKHKVRRFLSSRTLAPLSIYRKVRYYFKNKYDEDFKKVSEMVAKGWIRRQFNNTNITYMYVDPLTGEIEEVILWGKNAELLLQESKRTDNRFKLHYTPKENKKPTRAYVSLFEQYIFSDIQNKFIRVPVFPNKLKDYQLVQYYRSFQNQDIETLNIKHYGVVKNEMIKRGLLNEDPTSLNDYNEDFDFVELFFDTF